MGGSFYIAAGALVQREWSGIVLPRSAGEWRVVRCLLKQAKQAKRPGYACMFALCVPMQAVLC